MESWILHTSKQYDALPWPYPHNWEEVVRSDKPLIAACEDFGQVSPTDDSSEIPSVPTDLPRAMPRGKYAMAVYHDAQYLYVLLDIVDAPAIVTPEMFAKQVQVPADETSINTLIILSADERLLYRFSRDREGRHQAAVRSALYGPRGDTPPPVAFESQREQQRREGGERIGWRLERAGLEAAFDGNRIKLSISHVGYRSVEYVAWGGGDLWGPRPDEMGTVRLVPEPQISPWPVCRRIELHYDPQRETGRFRLYWQDPYGPEEKVVSKSEPNRTIPPHSCSLRLNGRQQQIDMGDEILSDELPIPDGHNFVEASTIGERSLRIYFEKRSGNRIEPMPYPAPTAMTREAVIERIRQETAVAHAALLERKRLGEPLNMRLWPSYHAASAGRAFALLEPDERLREILRVVADETLELQRPDGTFSGFHLGPGRSSTKDAPRWAGGAYDTGQAGELWAVAAAVLGDEKYRDASHRLLNAYEQYRIEFNHNYAAFTLYHLSAHYRLTRDPLALEHGLYYARHLAANKILPLGYQAGHNYYSVYGFITLRALAHFCQVLPEGEPYRAELRELTLRMANQLITRLQPDGSFDSRDRYFLGERLWLSALFSVAFLVKGDDLQRLDDVLQLMLAAPPETRRYGLLESEVVRYYACRERLLSGEKVELLGLV